MEKTTIKINDKLLKVLKYVLVFTMIAAQFAFLFFYALEGVAAAFGQNINIFSAIMLVLSFVNIGVSSFYKTTFGCALGILYIIFLVKLIRGIVVTIRYSKPAISKKATKSEAHYALHALFENFGNTYFLTLCFMILARMVGIYTVSANVIVCLAIGLAIMLFAKFIIAVDKHNNVLNAAYSQIICFGILFASTILFIVNVCTTTLHTSFNVFSALSTTIQYADDEFVLLSLIDKFAVGNILLIVLQINLLIFLYEILTTTILPQKSSHATRIFIISIATLVCHIALSATNANFMGFDIAPSVTAAVLNYLPIVIYSGIAWFSFKFPKTFMLAEGEDTEEDESSTEKAESAENNGENTPDNASDDSSASTEVNEAEKESENSSDPVDEAETKEEQTEV